METAFELREGKFGMYFYSTIRKKDMPLKDVLLVLNVYADITKKHFEFLSQDIADFTDKRVDLELRNS